MEERAAVIYHGHVQGIGFRYAARAAASRYALSGFVKNLTDGTVQLVAEGTRAEVEAFLEDLQRELSGFIRSREISWQPARGDWTTFSVRF